ncbi:MAG: Uncharacterised protein [Bacteroidetes bacterium MED-G17]|nr:MAG: Uncharacterised protein [Bacteroidetes bacterium MED-G17]
MHKPPIGVKLPSGNEFKNGIKFLKAKSHKLPENSTTEKKIEIRKNFFLPKSIWPVSDNGNKINILYRKYRVPN